MQNDNPFDVYKVADKYCEQHLVKDKDRPDIISAFVCGFDYFVNQLAGRNSNKETKFNEFDVITKNAMMYLKKNHHPHTKLIIDSGYAELVEGVRCAKVDD